MNYVTLALIFIPGKAGAGLDAGWCRFAAAACARAGPMGPREARPDDRLRRNPPLRSHGNVIGVRIDSRSELLQNSRPSATRNLPMIKTPLGFLIPVFLLCTPLCAWAQGTSQQNGIRSGYVGTSTPGATSPSSTNGPSGSPSRNSMGTGQSRSESSYGLTPQLHKELGISR